ncbi:indoleamine 2,3-dioxygenase family protein [Pseudovirgaria hyperparasitica]|uniref:Indoleamine 2,3-dioxygenase n=1 Tax=Pseudovirgaria hyperparasitica TaxID=470096 RepID=A0A6A6W978_9PEZI|nr:indoleamine 2,3-dioxygenase family protein [Pseudovirgaria hyperparasitica]KAF2757641.1 indoleamine 2,3-dioxygenase family protein [Pseudovirgaria hyperparasitica]
MKPQIPRLEDFGISPEYGFLPPELPLLRLPNPYYAQWEAVISNLQGLVLSKRLREVVLRLPVLSTEHLETDSEWRRAYVVLAFLSHAYIWGGDVPSEIVPPPISLPFLQVCRYLELPPVATYASVVLWNWRPVFDNEPIDTLSNLATLNTFTGSLDESWFYLVSVAIEARAAPILPMMLDAISAARRGDTLVVTDCLRDFAERLDELGTLLQRMYENCDPHVFYHRIRPFLAGSSNMASAGLPNGVMFDTGVGPQSWVQFSGGSNAQSSIIQFFDLVLGVEHRPTGERAQVSSLSSTSPGAPSAPPAPSNNFILDMRKYMPGPHRRFLEHVASIANIKDFVTTHQHDRALCTAYDASLAMLRAFRDKHIQMVSRYIIVKSRETRSHERSSSSLTTPPAKLPQQRKINIASALDPTTGLKKDGLRGTGGTALIPFLKQARDETGEPAIDAWARRLLGDAPTVGKTSFDFGGYRMAKTKESGSGEMEVVGLAGTWSVDDSEGGICHW